MRLLSIVFAALLLTRCESSTQMSQVSIGQFVDSLMTTAPDFSGVVLVADQGQPVYHKAFGFKDFGDETKLDVNSIFELASVSKQFTAMIIMMLQEDGHLNYDDPIDRYIPDLPYPGITIRHLLNHTSGLPDYQAIMQEHWDKSKVADNEDNIEYLIKYQPEKRFAPGEKYEYSNTGYMLLATIAEKASGQDFTQLCRDRIFRLLSMDHTDILTSAEKANLTDMTRGHIYVAEKEAYVRADSFPESNYAIWLGNREGPGRVSGTASDLLIWDRALYSPDLVTAETLQQAFSPARLNDGKLSQYGFGWMLRQHPTAGKIVMHTGDNPGYRSIIIRFIDTRKTLIVLTNNAHRRFDEIGKTTMEEICRMQ